MSEDPATWTIDRLARLTAAALAAGALAPQTNGRIREVPDVRTIRYYTSIGLLDRPAAMRGRTALYGRRHLAQLVAIKRLQAAGMTLTEVQERLLGVDEAAVERIAMLPADVEELEGAESAEGAKSAEGAEGPEVPQDSGTEGFAGSEDETAPASAPAPRTNGITPTRSQRFWSARPVAVPESAAAGPPPAEPAPLIPAVRLATDVTLLLTSASGRVPDPADRAAIAEAAQPLLDLLHRLGLSEG